MADKFIPPQYNAIYRDEKYLVGTIDWTFQRVILISQKGGSYVADFKDVIFKRKRGKKLYES